MTSRAAAEPVPLEVRVHVASADTRPGPRLHPDAERALRTAFGIDIAGRRPQGVDTVARRRFDHVITLCDKAREACPEFGHALRAHWSIPDPAAAGDPGPAGFDRFRRTTADIGTRVRHLLPVLATVPGGRS